MTFRIPRGKHRARPLRFGIWWKRPVFIWNVLFEESCRYDLKTDDQFDTNKLIGVGYLRGWYRPDGVPWWKLWKYRVKDSARFGWRYWTDMDKIELSAYCYIGGRRMIEHLGFVEIGEPYRLQLSITKKTYVFDVYDPEQDKAVGASSIPHLHTKKLQYRLGVYFGGQSRAQHTMRIQIHNYGIR